MEDTEMETENSMEIDKKCPACETHQPNQLAHMEPGGCLYDDYLGGMNLDE